MGSRVELATWLLSSGAGESTRRVLGRIRGAEANRLRIAARSARLGAGIYALGTLEDGAGVVIPMRATPGLPRGRDSLFGEACERARRLAASLLGERDLVTLRFECEEWLDAFGASVGLPAALAYLDHYVSSARRVARPVLATGVLALDGGVGEVDSLEAKVAVAGAESPDGMLLVPRGGAEEGVLDAEEAARIAFGPEALEADPTLLAVDAAIERSRAEGDDERAIAILSSLKSVSLAPADEARVELELGSRQRHLGRTDRAAAAHARAIESLGQVERVIGAEAAERFHLEAWSTALDEFRLEPAIEALRERLGRPFVSLRNEVRCRGLLGQALGMAGRSREALAARAENLPLHDGDQWLASVRPGTLCYLALDAARLGDADAFLGHARELLAATAAGDARQWRYNVMVIARGLVALGRDRDALDWLGGGPLFGVRAPAAATELYAGEAPIASHPEVSTARALVRALRRHGRGDEARRLADRVVSNRPNDLVGWLAELVHLEAVLVDLPEKGQIEAIRERMRRAHRAASRHDADVVDGPVENLEQAIDRVWY